jgi:thioesterase domain-containing protein
MSLVDIGGNAGDDIRSAIRLASFAALAKDSSAGRPIVVAGYSFGAVIAADLASWLGQQDVPVANLLLLDPKPLDSAPPGRRPIGTIAKVVKDVLRPAFDNLKRALSPPRSGGLSTAARQLQTDIDAVSSRLVAAYLSGSIRLPPRPVACVRSRELVVEQQPAPALFATPIELVDTVVLELGHHDLVSSGSGIAQVAAWLDRHLRD